MAEDNIIKLAFDIKKKEKELESAKAELNNMIHTYIVKCTENGSTIQQIADDLNMTHGKVYNIAVKLGVLIQNKNRKRYGN